MSVTTAGGHPAGLHEPETAEAAALQLLARALRGDDCADWPAFVRQYSGIVMSHIRRHAPETVAGEDDEFWLNRTFQRFAQAVGPDGLDRFPSLAAVLGYLKMCAYCTVLDELRMRRRHQHVSLDLLADSVDTGADLEHSVVDRLTAHELWDAAMRALPDETDRLVFRLSFKYGWKPQEIHEKYGDRFLSVADVYRTKRKLLERLRRDPQLRRFSP
jgi:hypothetical protein